MESVCEEPGVLETRPCQDVTVPRLNGHFMTSQMGRRVVVITVAAAFVAGCGAASTTSVHRGVRDSAREAVPSSTPTARASATTVPHVTAPVMSTTVPGAPNCPMFPANNVWNTNISRLPVDAHSAAWLASMNSATTYLHPDFGPDPGGYPYGIPFTVVSSAQPLVTINFQYASESDQGPYPFGPATPIEGGANAGGDRHAIMVNASTCALYELWDAHYSAGGSTAGSGAIWPLRSNRLRPAGPRLTRRACRSFPAC